MSSLDLDLLEGVLTPDELAEMRSLSAVVSGDLTIPFCPHKPTPKQCEFLMLPHRQALYGGAAGGGKSAASLMSALMYVDRPGSHNLIVRRTIPDLKQPGALMDMAQQWLSNSPAKFNSDDKKWTFPSGSTITFGHLESDSDMGRYQGGSYTQIILDEAGQHPFNRYELLASRLRKTADSDIPIRFRLTANPGGIGHDWLNRLFVEESTRKWPYVAARIEDNPHINREEYISSLSDLSPHTRDQLLMGLWVHDQRGLVYKCQDYNIVESLPTTHNWQVNIGIDLGSSERKKTTGIGVLLWSPDCESAYVAEAWAEAGLTPATVAEVAMETMERWGGEAIIVMDEGALGRGFATDMRVRHDLPVVAAQKRDKFGYVRLLNGDLQANKLRVHKADAKDLIKEWGTLMWDDSGRNFVRSMDDHISDAVLYAWRHARTYQSKEIVGEDISKISQVELKRRETEAVMATDLAKYAKQSSKAWWEHE